MKIFLLILLVIGFNSCNRVKEIDPKFQAINDIGEKIQIEDIPESNILFIQYRGDYSQHPKALTELMNYVGENYRIVGTCLGIYPFDPDAVPSDSLVWDVGIRVIPGDPAMVHEDGDTFQVRASEEELSVPLDDLKYPEAPYQLKKIGSTKAITVETIVENAGKEGLAMDAWLTMHGYVQVAPTIMEYAMVDVEPTKVPVKIIIPVKERMTGLSLI
ncbi:hypothetical protein [Ekhidna sp.]|uniref:hypothetical protein n=1 Tax=Ekhidna sp. TaxID=2608089 RepID=UPI0032EE0DD8